jgi:hypothetical protein
MYNSLRLPFAFDKGRRLLVAAKSIIFSCRGGKAFLQGVFAKLCVFNVVFLW